MALETVEQLEKIAAIQLMMKILTKTEKTH